MEIVPYVADLDGVKLYAELDAKPSLFELLLTLTGVFDIVRFPRVENKVHSGLPITINLDSQLCEFAPFCGDR